MKNLTNNLIASIDLTTDTIALIAGVVFIFIAVIGGGLRAKDADIPKISGRVRLALFIFGLIFCVPFIAQTFQKATATIPMGTIVAFHGAIEEVPKGWWPCDGSKGTPDLTGRFLRGAEKYSDKSLIGDDPGAMQAKDQYLDSGGKVGGEAKSVQEQQNTTWAAMQSHTHHVKLPPNRRVIFIMKL